RTATARSTVVSSSARPRSISRWPFVHREIDRGLALLVLVGTLEPDATPSIVARRLRERMDEHALAALFPLAALLDDARIVHAGEILARAPGERARAVVI